MLPMVRTLRASTGGICYHAINRGNGGMRVFHGDDDYRQFVDLIGKAKDRLPMRLVGYCLMPNHFHLVLWPFEDGDLSAWMQWLMTAHVRGHHRAHGTSGHLWQGRFKAFPIQQDDHLLAVLRYVEANPVRARLVDAAEDWPWSSAHHRVGGRPTEALDDGPVALPRSWPRLVDQLQPPGDLKRLRASVNRCAPFGTEAWSRRTAKELGLESTLRPRGRPPKPAAGGAGEKAEKPPKPPKS